MTCTGGRIAADRLSGFFDSAPGAGGELAWRFAKSAGAPLELLTDPTRWTSHRFRRLAACQTILNAIGNLLADRCQVEEFLFAEDIFGFFGKLPIRRRLVPKVIIPVHACHVAEDLS